MRDPQGGFSLIEVAVSVAIAAMLLAVGGVWMLSMRPGALRAGADGIDAALAAARSIAATSGNGATIAFLPGAHGGFVARVYSGRPTASGAVTPTNVLAVTSDATIREETFGAPPFAVFLSSSGHPTGSASYPALGTDGTPAFAVIAAQPPCPPGGVRLTIASPQGAPSETRKLDCDASVAGVATANPSPTPNVPILTPKALVAHWTSDVSALHFVATEWGYTHWFASATGMACGSVATYPGGSPYSAPYTPDEASSPPPPPLGAAYSYPNSAGGSMNDAPASFRLQPIPGTPGVCTSDIIDAFGQHATAPVQIMGDLTPSVPSLTFASPTSAAQTIAFSKIFDTDSAGVQLRFGGDCGQVIAYPPPVVARYIAASLSSTDASKTTISVKPNGNAAHCSLLVGDQYGEPPLTIPITIGHPRLRTWPNAVKYAQRGQTFIASIDTSRDPVAWVNRVLGGATAVAASPCKAQAFTDATYSTPDANPPSNVVGVLAIEGINVDERGCYMAAGSPAIAPLTVWEPDGSMQTYNPVNYCGFLVNSGLWHPSVTAAIASLDTAGGSGSGKCNINLDDGSGATLSMGHGIVAAQVAGPQNYSVAWNWKFICSIVGNPPMQSYKCNGAIKMTASMPDGTLITNCGGDGGFLGTFDPSGYNASGNGAGTSTFATTPPHTWSTWFQTAVNDAMADAQNFASADTFYNPSSAAITAGCP